MTDRGPGELWQQPGQPERPDAPRSEDDTFPLPDDDVDEALRRLLRDTVSDIEPTTDSLDRLRHAVPARRRRRRHLLLGIAASMALLAVGTPVVQHVASEGGIGGHQTVTGAHDYSTSGSTGEGGVSADPDADASGGSHSEDAGGDESGHATSQPSEGNTDSAGLDPSERDALGVSSPRCGREQLGEGVGETEEPDGQGRIYGSIRLVNVSGEICRIKGTDELSLIPSGRADSVHLHVVYRSEGDRASRLPLSDQYHDNLVLLPGEAYVVRFAWVPGGNGPGGCEPEPDPDDTDPPGGSSGSGSSGGTGDTEGSGGSTGGSGSSSDGSGDPVEDTGEFTMSEERSTGGTEGTSGGDMDGSGASGEPGDADGGSGTMVIIRYTPAAGEPRAVQIRLPGLCAGTVYRTGVLET